MKKRTKDRGTKNDDWETPDYIYMLIERLTTLKKEDLFDPCPLNADFDGLSIDWKDYNYINPPYNITDKPKFVKKAYEEYKKGKMCIMLIPATTETRWFHELIVPNALVYLIKGRVRFKGTNSKGEYVTDKTGQSGSMLIIFGDKSYKSAIKTLDIEKEVRHSSQR